MASTATALAVVVPSEADHRPGGARDEARGFAATNVIFLHGGGMGSSHRELTRLATVGQDGELVMDQLRYAGIVHTDPDDPDEPVTDSAAGATAYASGVRTYSGAIGVDAQGRPVPTLLEPARAAGKASGLVTTAQVTDASPAAFARTFPIAARRARSRASTSRTASPT